MRKGVRGLILLGLVIWGANNWLRGEDEFKPSVDFKGSRAAIGYLQSGRDGSYPHGSYLMPDVKLRTNLTMSPDMKVVLRMNLNNATFNSLDYVYLDYTNLFALVSPSLKDSAFNPTIRMGRLKVDFGEETWGNNAIESVVVSASAANVSGHDEGLQIFQSLPKEKVGIPLKWSFSFTNGNSGSGPDNNQAKAICAKVGVNPLPALYVSGSYYNSGDLGNATAEITYAGLATSPTNSTKWSRSLMELDVRYDFGLGKENRLEPGSPAFSDSQAFVRFAYGQFNDNGTGVGVTDRKGSYYFVDGSYNVVERLYLAGRYSWVGFDNSSVFATLNSVANANDYTRISVGPEYRLSEFTHFKMEYATNTEKMNSGVNKPDNNQISILLTTKF